MNRISYELRLLVCGYLFELMFKIVPKENEGLLILETIVEHYKKIQKLYPERFSEVK